MMEVIYLFREQTHIRAPLFAYDQHLFRRLLAKGGTWDRARQEFVFRRDMGAEEFGQCFSGTPYVWVDENANVPVRVFGFLERPANFQFALGKAAVTDLPKFAVAAPAYFTLPEKFSKHWQVKLETELRARKYSSRTQDLYLYFNRLLCTMLQKTPEEICPKDVTEFLAAIEKDKKYSAASINLAISAIRFFYNTVIKKEIISKERRPCQDNNLPMVLSKPEINKILDMEKNIKHRLLLMLAYSSGLCVS